MKPSATLRNNGEIQLDLEAVFEDPKATGRRWLIQYNERRKWMELEDMTDERLYGRLEDLRIKKARLSRRRNQYVQHTRNYYKAEMARVRAELRRRGLPVRKPTDGRVLATAAHIAVERAAA